MQVLRRCDGNLSKAARLLGALPDKALSIVYKNSKPTSQSRTHDCRDFLVRQHDGVCLHTAAARIGDNLLDVGFIHAVMTETQDT